MLKKLLCPLPYKINTGNGRYEFDEEICCYINLEFNYVEALELYNELWNNFTCGLSHFKIIKTQELKKNQILLTNSEEKNGFPELQEEYMVCVNRHGMMLEGIDETNVLRAFSTLLQILRPIHIENGKGRFAAEFVEIHDKAFLRFRGIHICIFPGVSLNVYKKVIRLAGILKYSHIVIEPWGTIKLDSIPELSWKDAFSKDEIRSLVKDANSMGMEVIPMINHLGHATMSRGCAGRHVVLDQNPQKALLFEPDGWSWCISNPVVRDLLKKVRSELIELCGKGSYFHLGCDEAGTYATCYECAKNDRIQLLADYINAISDDLSKQERRGIIWGDMLLDRSVWSFPYEANSYPDNPVHTIINRLDKNLIIADWQYEIKGEKFSNKLEKDNPKEAKVKLESSEYFIKNGFDVLTCPYQEYENIRALGLGASDVGALGMLNTTWHTLYDHMAAVAYASVVAWSGKKDLDNVEYILQLGRCCGNLTRKLVPSDGTYKNSGWISFEITS
jgi:hypothetical protein